MKYSWYEMSCLRYFQPSGLSSASTCFRVLPGTKCTDDPSIRFFACPTTFCFILSSSLSEGCAFLLALVSHILESSDLLENCFAQCHSSAVAGIWRALEAPPGLVAGQQYWGRMANANLPDEALKTEPLLFPSRPTVVFQFQILNQLFGQFCFCPAAQPCEDAAIHPACKCLFTQSGSSLNLDSHISLHVYWIACFEGIINLGLITSLYVIFIFKVLSFK